MSNQNLPVISLKKGEGRRFNSGCPWVFSNEIVMDNQTKSLINGTMVVLEYNQKKLAVGTFNPHSLIAFRTFSRDAEDVIDEKFIENKLLKAIALRETFFSKPFYRMIYSEADDLSGFIIDRLGEVFCVQANTAGAEILSEKLVKVLLKLFPKAQIVFKNETASRKLEGLELYTKSYNGELKGEVELIENEAFFFADVVDGQKTGWFYDQRDNRNWVAKLAKDKTVADFYSYAGGFAILSAVRGAKEVTAIDRSERALELAKKAAEKNKVLAKCNFIQAEAFTKMEEMIADGKKFDVVVVDPPAFIKSKKDIKQGAKGYQKMARLASQLVQKDGFFIAASCSHHITTTDFIAEISQGVKLAGKSGKIIKVSGAGADHPVHIGLPEMSYLKAVFLQLD